MRNIWDCGNYLKIFLSTMFHIYYILWVYFSRNRYPTVCKMENKTCYYRFIIKYMYPVPIQFQIFFTFILIFCFKSSYRRYLSRLKIFTDYFKVALEILKTVSLDNVMRYIWTYF